MKFIQMLQEASSAALEDVKNSLKKDPATKVLFSKNSTLADVTDKEKFLATVKFHLLNNKNVKDFAASRSMPAADGKPGHYGVRYISAGELSEFRKLVASTIDESDFQQLKVFIADLFKEYKNSIDGVVSADTRKELSDWANSNGRYFNLSMRAQQELKSVSSIRPDKKVVLYRGLLFKAYDLENRKTYDGTNVEGNGLKFMKNIRDGKDIVDIDWERPSSWTTSKTIAERFAKYSAAGSAHMATLNWLSRGKEAIDGELGFVISTLANPEDILLDVNRLRTGLGLNHGDEGEIILAPGKITARVVDKYNRQGKVEKVDDSVKEDQAKKIKEALSILDKIKKLKIDKLVAQIPETNMFDNPDLRVNTLESFHMTDMFHDKKTPEVLKLTDKINETHTSLNELMKEFKEKIGDFEFTTDMVDVKDNEAIADIKRIQSIQKYVNETTKSSHFKDGRGLMIDLPVDKYRMTIGDPSDIRETADKLRFVNGDNVKPRIHGKELGAWFNHEYKKLTGTSLSSRFEMLGEPKQKPAVEAVIKNLFDKYGFKMSDSYKENLDSFINLSRRIHRNVRMLSRLNSIHNRVTETEED